LELEDKELCNCTGYDRDMIGLENG